VFLIYSFVIHYLVDERVGQNGRFQFSSEKQGHKFLGLVTGSRFLFLQIFGMIAVY
jgi:hypothetical protein